MNRLELEKYIYDTYGVMPEYPWEKYNSYGVFRHCDNKKWFALVMSIKKSKLGLDGDGYIDVVNMKCAPEIMDDLYSESGVFPAYHMSKKHWLTLTLDGTCSDETIKWVARISYDLTRRKIKKKSF